MNSILLKKAFEDAGISPDDFDPQIMVGVHFKKGASKVAVYVASVNAYAFELPMKTTTEDALAMAEAVASWDYCMAEGMPIRAEVEMLVRGGAQSMAPCPLKEIIDSAYRK